MKTYKHNEAQPKKARSFINNITTAIKGIANLAFLSASGVGAYVLWFSSDSLTLKVVAGVLALQAAVQALAMSTKE